MLDPRKDLQRDSMLWELVLTCATAYKGKQIFGNLHGFRCAGSQLHIKGDTLSFQLPEEWNEEFKQSMKQKYAIPYIKQFRELFKFAKQYYQEHRDALVSNGENDFFTRDVFYKGYLF